MSSQVTRAASRRRFLQYLAGSPLFASGALSAYGAEAPSKLPDPMTWAPAGGDLIDTPKAAINVFDFEPVAHKNVPPAHFGYMASGLDDEVTLRANREGFLKFQLRPHRLNDVSKVDTSIELFGTKYDSPIFVCPTGGNRFFHPDGEVAVAKAARAGNHLQILSTSSNYSVEDVTKARGAPVWFQLYASPSWEVAQALIKKADAAGSPVLMVTVDRIAGRNQETLFRMRRSDTRECSACHDRSSFAARSVRRHNYDGIDLSGITGGGESSNLSWDTVKRMRDVTRMKIMLKGIVTAEDAELAVQNGLDGILVSNHGGRGQWSLHHRRAAGNHRRREGANARDRRQWVPPRHRRGQGARDGRGSGRYRPALSVGARSLRPGRRGAGAGDRPHRNARGHAAMWRALGEGARSELRTPGLKHQGEISGSA
jgi:isopentenyl diphosphate isomerase/L-lactate dehydrogenase-like FMN-dependent dehydrogenase